jgi:hypothetical protein
MVDMKFRDYKEDSVNIEAILDKFIEMKIKKVKKESENISFFLKEILYKYLDKSIEINYELLNNFNISFLSSTVYALTLRKIDWTVGDNKDNLPILVSDFIHRNIADIAEYEPNDLKIIGNLSDNFELTKEVINNNFNYLKGKELLIVYIPYIESENKEYYNLFIENLITSIYNIYGFFGDFNMILSCDFKFNIRSDLKDRFHSVVEDNNRAVFLV